jgi:hypothetical protein
MNFFFIKLFLKFYSLMHPVGGHGALVVVAINIFKNKL